MTRALLALLFIASCAGRGDGAGEDPGKAAPVATETPGPARVQVSDRVMRDAGIKTSALQMATLPATTDLTGEVAADPDHAAQVAVRVAGRIVAVRFQEGELVVAGQPLAVIESSEVARIRAELTSTMTRADAVHKRVDRLVAMVEVGTASTQDLETARAEAGALDADVAGARQTLASLGGGGGATARLEIRAPLAGVILRRAGVVGQPVAADHVIAEIVNLDHAAFLARLFEHDLERVHEGAAATVQLDAYPGVSFPGKVVTIGRQVEPTARAVIARIAIDDRDGLLKIGLFGTAHVVVPDPATAAWPVVPTSAVTSIADRPVVFVEVGTNEFEARPVEIGHADGGKVEIVKGLAPTDRIAITGLFTLKSLALKSTFGEEE